MPKLDGTHFVERLQKRIAELEAGNELAARDVAALLTPEQSQQLADAWAEQQRLRQLKPARSKSEQQELGWRSKREVRLEVLREALMQAMKSEKDAWKHKVLKVKVRQTRIYFDALNEAEKAGKDKSAAQNWANNELTRAGLRRMDGVGVGSRSRRDREVEALEAELRSEKDEVTGGQDQAEMIVNSKAPKRKSKS